MGPKTAKAVPEKVIAKDEAQIVYINIKLNAPVPPPPALSSNMSTTDIQSTPSKASKSSKPTKPKPVSEPVPVAPTPVVDTTTTPAQEEMQEVHFEILANVLCRSDIFIDYIRRHCIKLIQEKLSQEDPEKSVGEPMKLKLKDLQNELTAIATTDMILRDSITGNDISFKEVSIKKGSSVVLFIYVCIDIINI